MIRPDAGVSGPSTRSPTPHVALYPGSFDPITFGHLDVVARGRRLFDRLVVAGHSFAYTSSSLIRQITAMGSNLDVLSPMVPRSVIERLKRKKAENPEVLRRLVVAVQ